MQLDADGGYVVYASERNGYYCLTYKAEHSWLDTVECTGAWYQNFPGTVE